MKINGIPGELTISRVARFLISCVMVDVAYRLRSVLPSERLLWLLMRGHVILNEEDRKADDIGRKATIRFFFVKAKKNRNTEDMLLEAARILKYKAM